MEGIVVRALVGDEVRAALSDLAHLRRNVFRAWPYLYDGDAAYEQRYLATFAAAPGATIIAAIDPSGPAGGRLVGAATACPLAHADDAFVEPFRDRGMNVREWFYFGESVLDQAYRGRGIGVAFFREREGAARAKLFRRCCFCAVVRSTDDARRPNGHVALDGFWERRGYRPIGLTALYRWRDVGAAAESAKFMRFWGRDLPAG